MSPHWTWSSRVVLFASSAGGIGGGGVGMAVPATVRGRRARNKVKRVRVERKEGILIDLVGGRVVQGLLLLLV